MCAFCRCGTSIRFYIAVCPFSASWRIVHSRFSLVLNKAYYTDAANPNMQLEVLHREAWPINAHYWLDMRYVSRVLHFSAIVFDIL